jgi:glycosyltransferase involved in cell wall biosynthesis
MISIIIPTIKSKEEIQSQVNAIKSNMVSKDYEIIATCEKVSAARNRNNGLYQSKGEYVITLDDDISGYWPGWVEKMIEPLKVDINIKMVSAKLLNLDGTQATMDDFRSEIIHNVKWFEAPRKKLPSACVSMRRNDWLAVKANDHPKVIHNVPYDERYQNASFEDTDGCRALGFVFPNAKFIVNNECKIFHANLECWRPGFDWTVNQKLYISKWGS